MGPVLGQAGPSLPTWLQSLAGLAGNIDSYMQRWHRKHFCGMSGCVESHHRQMMWAGWSERLQQPAVPHPWPPQSAQHAGSPGRVHGQAASSPFVQPAMAWSTTAGLRGILRTGLKARLLTQAIGMACSSPCGASAADALPVSGSLCPGLGCGCRSSNQAQQCRLEYLSH